MQLYIVKSLSYYQSEEDAEQLYDVGVGDRIETAEQSVGDGDQSRHNDRHIVVNVDDDGQRRPYKYCDFIF